MAMTDYFGASSAELIAEQSAKRKRELTSLLEDVVTPETKKQPVLQAAATVGAVAGKAIGEAIGTRLYGPSPEQQEIDRARRVEEKLLAVEDTWEDDPELDAGTNMANKIDVQIEALGGDITTNQRLQLQGQKLALLNEAFQRSRLVASDQREVETHKQAMKDAGLDFQISELKLKQTQRVAERGAEAELGVFRLADGSRQTVGMGGEAFSALLDAANEGGKGVEWMGWESDLAAATLASQKSDAKAAEPPKMTKADRDFYNGLSQMGTLFDKIAGEDVQKGIDRFGGWTAYWDNFREHIAPFSLGLVEGATPSLEAHTAMSTLSIIQQQLIPGVPSNYDQFLIELTKPDRLTTSPEQARSRIGLMQIDVVNRARAAYADYKAAYPEAPVPASLVNSVEKLGILPSTIQSAEEERAKVEQSRAAILGTATPEEVAAAREQGILTPGPSTKRRFGDLK